MSAVSSPVRPTQFADSPKATSNRNAPAERRKNQLKDDSILSTNSAASPVEDPLRILQPAQKKLSGVESQRVISVLDEAIKRLEIVSAIPHLMNALERHSVSLGSELTRLLNQHKTMSEEFNHTVLSLGKDSYGDLRRMSSEIVRTTSTSSLSSEKSSITGGGSRIKLEPIVASAEDSSCLQEKLDLLTEKLRHSTKCILRAFSANPTAYSVVKMANNETSYGTKTFKSSMGELRTIVHERLLTTKMEEETKRNHVAMMSQRENELQKKIAELEETFAAAKRISDEEIGKKRSLSRSLKSDIQTVKKISEEANKRTDNEAERQKMDNKKSYESKKGQLDQEIAELKKNLNDLVTKNRESELQLRKKAFKRETEVENWVQRYDSEMDERQVELEEVSKNYQEEKSQLEELEEKFSALEEEYTVIQEEKRIAREREEKAAREMDRALRAATTIQAFWRSYKCRKALKKEQKGKGKKGSGKGKKKKGSGKKTK